MRELLKMSKNRLKQIIEANARYAKQHNIDLARYNAACEAELQEIERLLMAL